MGCYLLTADHVTEYGRAEKEPWFAWWIGDQRRLLRETPEDQVLQACTGTSSLIVMSAGGWVHIHNRHVRSIASTSVEEGIDIDLFIVISGIVAIMWCHIHILMWWRGQW
jgi:hypothetical protein